MDYEAGHAYGQEIGQEINPPSISLLVAETRRVNTTFSHTAAASESGGSFLDLLCQRFTYHNREEWEGRIRDGRVLLDERIAPSDTKMRLGMRLEYQVVGYEEPMVPISFREIISNPDLALVHKPAGQPVHKTGKIFIHTLANLYRQSRGDEAWTPLNRLDVETSGIVAFARGREALRRFSPLEPGTRWKKLYLAVVQGSVASPGSVDLALREKTGALIRNRMYPDVFGKPATTVYHPLAQSNGKTLLLLRTLTGRKHQIRAHLSARGFPIVGDKVYSLDGHYYLKRLEGELSPHDLEALGAPHQLLHAFHLEIRTEDGGGIQGTDFDLPETFFDLFPKLEEAVSSLPQSESFRSLCAD